MTVFPQAFPILPDSKRPSCKWSDPSTCRPSNTFGYRHGLPTGPRNGVWVLDVDRKNGVDGLASLTAYADGRGLPDTYTVKTPSGGMHLYFRWDAARPVGNAIGTLPGVDVRGAGGYVCAGGDYTVALDAPIADAPEWLYALVGKRAEPGRAAGASAVAIGPEHPEWGHRIALAEAFIAGEPPCVSGKGGQAQIWKMALRIMRTYELPVATAVTLLAPYNARCVPPWSAGELTRTLVRAAEEGHGPTGTFAADFLRAVPVPAEGGPWRQVKNPEHVYSVDLAQECAGAMVTSQALGPKELTATFSGPSAVPLWVGVWQYNDFRRRIVAVNPPFKLDAESAGLSKRDLASVQVWLACSGGKCSTANIENALEVAARQAEFHPVRDYLDALQKVPLAEANAYFTGIAGRLWGATSRDELESGHLRRFAIAAVRRIRRPGTKVDTMLVLAGEQGFRKSHLCAKLFGAFFLDQVPPISSGRGHEASIAIEGHWGIEIPEMHAFLHTHESAKKEFITRNVDKYRPVFGIAVQESPRQCVFVGTTNDDDFLTDPTGDTRYDICDIQNVIEWESIDRDLFWASADALEASGEMHWRDRAELTRDRAKSAEESAAFQSEDAWADVILKFAAGAKEGFVTASECLTYGLVIPTEKQDARGLNRVKGVLRRAFGASKVKLVDGRARRIYYVR